MARIMRLRGMKAPTPVRHGICANRVVFQPVLDAGAVARAQQRRGVRPQRAQVAVADRAAHFQQRVGVQAEFAEAQRQQQRRERRHRRPSRRTPPPACRARCAMRMIVVQQAQHAPDAAACRARPAPRCCGRRRAGTGPGRWCRSTGNRPRRRSRAGRSPRRALRSSRPAGCRRRPRGLRARSSRAARASAGGAPRRFPRGC